MKRPAHAKDFKGGAKCIPAEDSFFLGYQNRWIKDDSIMKIMEKSRRVGVSYGTAYRHVRQHSLKTNVLDTWVSSRDEPTARQFVRDANMFANVFQLGGKDMGESVLQTEDGNKVSVHTLALANRAAIFSLASNPDVFAGKGGNVELDEFALRKHPDEVYAIAAPTIDWGGHLSIISTHRGSGNYFNTLIREIKEKKNPKGFSLHRVSLQDALDDGFLWKLQKTRLTESDPRFHMDEADYFNYQQHRCRDRETFLQEYMCVPADDLAAFIEYNLIDACTYREGENWKLSLEEMRKRALAGAEFYSGTDIGRVHDLTSCTVVERVVGQRLVRHRLDLRDLSFATQESILYPIYDICRRNCIDKTGLGMQFAERAAQRFGEHKVEGVGFSGPVKEDLAYPVRSAFEDRSIRIGFEDDALIRAIRAIRKEVTTAGNIRFVAESNDEGHADEFWGLALALHASKTPNYGSPTIGRVTSPKTSRARRLKGL